MKSPIMPTAERYRGFSPAAAKNMAFKATRIRFTFLFFSKLNADSAKQIQNKRMPEI